MSAGHDQPEVLRKGQEVSVTAEVGRLEDGEKLADASGSQQTPAKPAPAVVTVLGMTVTSITDELRAKYGIDKDLKGAVITEIAQDGPAADRPWHLPCTSRIVGVRPARGAARVCALRCRRCGPA